MKPTITISQLMNLIELTEDTYESRWKKLREFIELAEYVNKADSMHPKPAPIDEFVEDYKNYVEKDDVE